MPYIMHYVPADLFLEHDGIKIFRDYDDGMYDEPLTNHFSTTDDNNEDSLFDVRDLTTWKEPAHPPYLNGENDTPENRVAWERYHEDNVLEKAQKAAIIAAIENGEIFQYIIDEE